MANPNTSSVPFFKFPDNNIFHGIAGNDKGFTYLELRNLVNADDPKMFYALDKRLHDFLFNGIHETTNPFLIATLTCVCCDVLGQIQYGLKTKSDGSLENKSDTDNTVKVFEEIDITNTLKYPMEQNFFDNYKANDLRHTYIGANEHLDNTKPKFKYSRVFNHGLRNCYVHSYRAFGVVLNDKLQNFFEIKENDGLIIVNPRNFWLAFYSYYKKWYEELQTNTEYQDKVTEYLRYII